MGREDERVGLGSGQRPGCHQVIGSRMPAASEVGEDPSHVFSDAWKPPHTLKSLI